MGDAGWKVTSGLLGALVLLVGLLWNNQDKRIDNIGDRLDTLEKTVLTYRAGREALEALKKMERRAPRP